MGQGYRRFKQRAVLGAWIKACLFGVALGMMVFAGWLLLDKLLGQTPQMLYYAAAGGGMALVSGGLLLVGIYPTDRRLAKRLDDALGLDEKVQTMVAYRKEESPMVLLQRQNTDEILGASSTKRARSRTWWLHLVAPVLAIAMMVSAVLVPAAAEKPEGGPVDPMFQLSEWQEMALRQLIDEVKISAMEAAPKGETVARLEQLLIDVKNATRESVMKKAVVDAIVAVHGIVKSHNTYLQVGSALNTSETETVKSWGAKVLRGDPIGLSRAMEATRQTLTRVGIHETLGALTSALSSALDGLELSVADPLYRGLVTLVEALQEIAEAADGMTDVALTEALDMAFKTADGSLSGAIQQQRFNETVRDDVIITLMAIFGITAEELPAEVLPADQPGSDGNNNSSQEPSEDDDDENKDNGGGMGEGDMLYGSDDIIYDPEKDTYVTYGEVLNEYYAKISEKLVDGKLSPELEDMISDYFASLYDGSAKDGQ